MIIVFPGSSTAMKKPNMMKQQRTKSIPTPQVVKSFFVKQAQMVRRIVSPQVIVAAIKTIFGLYKVHTNPTI